MKSFKYTINGNVYKVHINSIVDDEADVEVNGTPYHVKMEKLSTKLLLSYAITTNLLRQTNLQI